MLVVSQTIKPIAAIGIVSGMIFGVGKLSEEPTTKSKIYDNLRQPTAEVQHAVSISKNSQNLERTPASTTMFETPRYNNITSATYSDEEPIVNTELSSKQKSAKLAEDIAKKNFKEPNRKKNLLSPSEPITFEKNASAADLKSSGVGALSVNNGSFFSNSANENNNEVSLNESNTSSSGSSVIESPIPMINIANWRKRRKVTIDNSTQSENLINFPLLLVLDASKIDYLATHDFGYDLLVVDSDGVTVLDYEIEKWDKSGNSYVWVRVPQIDALSSTDFIYIYYDNPDITSDNSNPSGVWDSNYEAVYHLSGNYLDSTSNNRNGMNLGTTFVASGKIGGSINCDENLNESFETGVVDSLNTFTIETWSRSSSAPGGSKDSAILAKEFNYLIHWDSTFLLSGSSSVETLTTNYNIDFGVNAANQWYYFAVTLDSSFNLKSYQNGLNTSSTTTDGIPRNDDGVPATVCWQKSSDEYFNGEVDEVRISKTARSSEWIKAQELSMTDSLVSYGAEEIVP